MFSLNFSFEELALGSHNTLPLTNLSLSLILVGDMLCSMCTGMSLLV